MSEQQYFCQAGQYITNTGLAITETDSESLSSVCTERIKMKNYDTLGPVCFVCNRGLGIRQPWKPEKRKRRKTRNWKGV